MTGIFGKEKRNFKKVKSRYVSQNEDVCHCCHFCQKVNDSKAENNKTSSPANQSKSPSRSNVTAQDSEKKLNEGRPNSSRRSRKTISRNHSESKGFVAISTSDEEDKMQSTGDSCHVNKSLKSVTRERMESGQSTPPVAAYAVRNKSHETLSMEKINGSGSLSKLDSFRPPVTEMMHAAQHNSTNFKPEATETKLGDESTNTCSLSLPQHKDCSLKAGASPTCQEDRALNQELPEPRSCRRTPSECLESTIADETPSSFRKALQMDEMKKQMLLSEQFLKIFNDYSRIVHCMKETICKMNNVLKDFYVEDWPEAEGWFKSLLEMMKLWTQYENDLKGILAVVTSHLEMFENVEDVLNRWMAVRDEIMGLTHHKRKNKDCCKDENGSAVRVAAGQCHYEVNPAATQKLEKFKKIDHELEAKFSLIVASRVQFIEKVLGKHFKTMACLYQNLTQVSRTACNVAVALPCYNPCIPIGCSPCPPRVRFFDVCDCRKKYEKICSSKGFYQVASPCLCSSSSCVCDDNPEWKKATDPCEKLSFYSFINP